MKADRLLRLYPRAWRERYGDEFLELVGDRPLTVAQLIDSVSGAIDAHLSSDVRATTVARRSDIRLEGEAAVLNTPKIVCYHDIAAPFSKRDAWIGAAVMIAATAVFSTAGILFDRVGYEALGDAAKAFAFPASLLLSMPFTYVKGQSWRAQCVLVGIPLAILALITYIAIRL
ncbi:MAG TPA: hypothetical protein VH679_03410 [Vicinamibacterales bacterium]|jgi:hypothetical protein